VVCGGFDQVRFDLGAGPSEPNAVSSEMIVGSSRPNAS
jgi:hypothetical protein